MPTIQVFDPPMCCSTGVCGPNVDPALARFAADLDWLRRQGIVVERFNPAQQPAAFTSNSTVKAALAQNGTGCLPLILVDGNVVSLGRYPGREALADAVGAPREPAKPAASSGLRVVEVPASSASTSGGRKCC